MWSGYVHGHNYGGKEGLNLQQIYEAGMPFAKLIDHPSWINHMLEFVGGKGTFDHLHGPLFIDENFANIRGPGEAIGIHSGNPEGLKRNNYRYQDGKFNCSQVNILIALNNIGPGDGGTVIIPSSHNYFPAPGSSESYYHLYLGEIQAFDGERIRGLEKENEDILVKSFKIDEVRQMLKEKKIMNGLTLVALQWFFLEYYKG